MKAKRMLQGRLKKSPVKEDKWTFQEGGPLFYESNESMSHESMSQADFYAK